jgi:hypothetical protein
MVELNKKEIIVPSECELEGMIKRHLEFGKSRELTTISMRGYLAALLDHGVIEFERYSNLIKLLPNQWGKRQSLEIFLGPEEADEE